MFGKAEDGIRQRLPVLARADRFNIAANFAFVAQQQGNVVPAVAQVKPQRMAASEGRFSLLAVDYLGERRGDKVLASSVRPASQEARRAP